MYAFFRRRMAFLVLAALAGNVLLDAQAPTGGGLRVVAAWEPGDSQSYLVSLESEYSLLPQEPVKNTADYRVTISVVDRTEEGYILEWLYENVSGTGSGREWPLLCRAEGLRIRYSTDQYGRFLHLINWLDFVEYPSTNLRIVPLSDRNRHSDVRVENAPCPYTTKEELEADGLREIKLFHAIYGYGVADEEQFGFMQRAWNEIEEDPVELVSSPELAYHSAGDRIARFKANTAYKPEPDSGRLFNVEGESLFHMQLDTGWPLVASSIVSSTRGEMYMEDTISFWHAD